MEKAIEIKRRAQRCIQNGDLDGALAEYEKLVGAEESDPYNYVLLADLLYKKGDQQEASERYLSAVGAYEKASLYKNAIAVCKKMLRLSLSPAKVLNSLARLHLLDGLAGEAALYYVQYAEHMVRSSAPTEAAQALRQAFDACQDNLKVLEQLSEAWLLAGENAKAAEVMHEASSHYHSRGLEADAQRCVLRAHHLAGTVAPAEPVQAAAPAAPVAPAPQAAVSEAVRYVEPSPAVAALEPGAGSFTAPVHPIASEDIETRKPFAYEAPVAEAPAAEAAQAEAAPEFESHSRLMARPAFVDDHAAPEGFDSGRHDFELPVQPTLHAPGEDVPAAEADATATGEDDFAVTEAEAEASFGAIEATTPESEEAGEDAEEPVYEIGEDELDVVSEAEVRGESAAFAVAAAPEPAADVYEIDADETSADGVYEIDIDETVEAEAEPTYEIAEEPSAPVAMQSPESPGLSFAASAPEPHAHTHGHSHVHANGFDHVEQLLARAQEHFRSGDRDLATATLSEAAQAYERLGRFDSAATIYRSLGRGAQASPALMELWLANCELRRDAAEAAQVACELGDRALNDGDESRARSWFERAITLDAANETARRRLQRLAGAGSPNTGGIAIASAAAVPPPPANTDAPPPIEAGRVEVAVGRAEAVTFDLAGLLSEFQKGVEAQLAGDAQSHYDLGMTYREMGLLEQAIDSFRVAQEDSRLTMRSLEMIGRCRAEQGRHDEACGEFRRALELPGVGPDNDAELRFHFGNSLAESGQLAEALGEYERVTTAMPGFEDVDDRIVALRRVLGQA